MERIIKDHLVSTTRNNGVKQCRKCNKIPVGMILVIVDLGKYRNVEKRGRDRLMLDNLHCRPFEVAYVYWSNGVKRIYIFIIT